jgi:hypothetical protein
VAGFMAKRARKKSKAGDIILIVVGISILVAIFVAAVLFAPDSPFSDSGFVQDVGRRNAY